MHRQGTVSPWLVSIHTLTAESSYDVADLWAVTDRSWRREIAEEFLGTWLSVGVIERSPPSMMARLRHNELARVVEENG